MTIIQTTILIRAPIATVFRLSLTIDLEQASAQAYNLKAISGVTTGVIGPGERVTWSATQFGIPIRHTTEITAYQAPTYFQDSMIRGIFRSFAHDHYFAPTPEGHTLMRDEMRFAFPLILLGKLSETLVVAPRMRKLLAARNAFIQQTAEGPDLLTPTIK